MLVFKKSAEELYKVLATKSRTAKSVNNLGSDGRALDHGSQHRSSRER